MIQTTEMDNAPRVLVTGFLGKPLTDFSKLSESGARYAATRDALRQTKALSGEVRVLLACTGDKNECERLVAECDFPTSDVAWFPQSPTDIAFGKGLLEHKLIVNAIRHWGLVDSDLPIVKLTAKYVAENLPEILEFARNRSLPIYGWRHVRKPWIDSRCYIFQGAAYMKMSETLNTIDDRRGYFMEQALYECMQKLHQSSGLVRFRPIISGLSGSAGIEVRTNILKRVVIRLASI